MENKNIDMKKTNGHDDEDSFFPIEISKISILPCGKKDLIFLQTSLPTNGLVLKAESPSLKITAKGGKGVRYVKENFPNFPYTILSK